MRHDGVVGAHDDVAAGALRPDACGLRAAAARDAVERL